MLLVEINGAVAFGWSGVIASMFTTIIAVLLGGWCVFNIVTDRGREALWSAEYRLRPNRMRLCFLRWYTQTILDPGIIFRGVGMLLDDREHLA